jgi:TRAP-type mannitol/chloroaromatic compound transport system permease small subunit
MKWLQKIVFLIDQFTDLTGKLIAKLTFVMVLLSFLVVLLRYGFNLGWIAMQESVMYLHGFIFMLGAAYTLKADGHVRVDIFYQLFSVKTKAWVNILGGVFLLLPLCVFIFYISFDYVQMSWYIMEKSPEAGGLPFVYISKSFILLLAVTLSLQGISEILRNIIVIKQSNANATATELS